METLVITGAGGHVGAAIRPLLRDKYHLALLDRVAIGDAKDNESAIVADIGDEPALVEAFRGAAGIVHLAGCTTEEPIRQQIAGNVQGAWNVFSAAKEAGVARVVFTSSHHVVGHYPRYRRLGPEAILRPDSRYGLTKAFGEHCGAFFADQSGLRVLAIRVGFVGEKPIDRRRLAIWISPRDLVQLIEIGLTHESLRYALVYGVSNNARGFFDNSAAFALGYRPQDSADDHAAAILAGAPENPDDLGSRVIGGAMAEQGFSGDPTRIDEW